MILQYAEAASFWRLPDFLGVTVTVWGSVYEQVYLTTPDGTGYVITVFHQVTDGELLVSALLFALLAYLVFSRLWDAIREVLW